MDAMIMDGSNMEIGAITGVHDIFHPISLAKKVMEKTEYNFLGPKGAMEIAKSEGFQILPPGTLETPSRRRALDNWLRNNNLTLLTDVRN
jgi:beta-aspartyl-peptidase (threonine type)